MANYDFVVLGATGIQGRIVVKDLLENNYSVLMCGRDKSRITYLLKQYKKTDFEYVDITDVSHATDVIKKSKANVVVNCMEGDWNLDAYQACLNADVHCIDLGSEIPITKEQLALDGQFKKKKLIGITGCGSVPGIGNVMLKYAAEKFDEMDTIEVGFSWDSNIKKFVVPFSIQSIIEEFTGPAPIVEQCRFIKKTPMDTIAVGCHRRIGKQKEFLIGHHPETYTFYNYFKNKGVRNVKFYAGFPQHSFDSIMSMIELGFGSKEEIDFKGIKIKPVEFLTEVLKNIEIPKGYEEEENLWVRIYGKKNGKNKKIVMECIVPPLKGWEDAGCNIDTGMPASIIAQMIKKGEISANGSYAPEGIVPPELLFTELRKRKMVVYENGKVIN